jgi:DNA-binding ferritin-like protein
MANYQIDPKGAQPNGDGTYTDSGQAEIDAAKNAGPQAAPRGPADQMGTGEVQAAQDENAQLKAQMIQMLRALTGGAVQQAAQPVMNATGASTNESFDELEDKDEIIDVIESRLDEMSDEEFEESFDDIIEAISEAIDADEYDEDESYDNQLDIPENTYNFSEDLNALVESESTLSSEFREKAATIFEAAINAKLSETVSHIEEQLQAQFDERLEEARVEIVESVDEYMDFVVEQWVADNELAIEAGLRTQVAENFMEGLKQLFAEHYIDVPESKVDMVDELSERVVDLEDELNNTIENAMAIAEELNSYKRDYIINEMSTGLVASQVEKLKALAENLDFEDEETFVEKVNYLRSSYFNNTNTQTSQADFDYMYEDTEGSSFNEDISTSPEMSSYISALRSQNKG